MSKLMYKRVVGAIGFTTVDEFKESDHPRADNGQFGSGGGGKAGGSGSNQSNGQKSKSNLSEQDIAYAKSKTVPVAKMIEKNNQGENETRMIAKSEKGFIATNSNEQTKIFESLRQAEAFLKKDEKYKPYLKEFVAEKNPDYDPTISEAAYVYHGVKIPSKSDNSERKEIKEMHERFNNVSVSMLEKVHAETKRKIEKLLKAGEGEMGANGHRSTRKATANHGAWMLTNSNADLEKYIKFRKKLES